MESESKEYQAFVDKFKPKKTTDDCYTPKNIYEVVKNWVAKEYNQDESTFCRPFYPGGDYEHYDYVDKVVVDNPPFSILSQILKFYVRNNVKFFLFCPTLTIIGNNIANEYCTIITGAPTLTYENGAKVNTSFITNLDDIEIRIRTAPDLYKNLTIANLDNIKTKKLNHHKYPKNVMTISKLYPLGDVPHVIKIRRDESVRVRALDAQRPFKKSIYNAGLLVSDNVVAELERAELEHAELKRAELERAELECDKTRLCWELSEREQKIIDELNGKVVKY